MLYRCQVGLFATGPPLVRFLLIPPNELPNSNEIVCQLWNRTHISEFIPELA